MPLGVNPITYAIRLGQIQSAQEVTWGTPLAATARWMGVAAYPQFKPFQKSTNYDENRGSLGYAFNSNILQLGGDYSVNWTYASYEDINYALMNVLKSVNPTGVNPYTYTYPGPLTAINPLLPYTLEYGYNIITGQYAGCLGNKLTIKGESIKQWELALSGFYKTYTPFLPVNIVSSTNTSPIVITTASDLFVTGQQVSVDNHLVNTAANGTWVITRTGAGTYSLTGSTGNGIGGATGTITRIQTPSIADRTIEAIKFPGTTLAIDNAGGTPGTTPFLNVFLGFQLDLENAVQPIWTGDSLNPVAYAYDRFKVSLMVRLLETIQVKTMIENQLFAGNRQVFQIKQTSGPKSCEIDFAGVLIDNPARYGNHNGAAMIELKLEGQVDTGSLANQVQVIDINAVSALP